MKFTWFNLMPWPHLPDDFRQKYRSVWVDVPSHLFDPAKAHDMYIDYLDELEYAAEMGFDGLCVNEHHQNAYGLMPSPNLMAATLARQSSPTIRRRACLSTRSTTATSIRCRRNHNCRKKKSPSSSQMKASPV